MSSRTDRLRPVVLCILDGWGVGKEGPDNAIALADAANWARFLANSPHALLDASEHEVGLPAGQMGNSEVGHMNIGGGRVVMQELPRIDRAIQEDALRKNPALVEFIARLKSSGGACHLMGLLSPGGVHSHQAHLASLANILVAAGVPVRVHAFLDGRDTPPSSARGYLKQFLSDVAISSDDVRIATISGRYYAMDRDKRWERIALAYRAMVLGKGEKARHPLAALDAAYARGETDEFVKPTVITGFAGISDGDGVLMGNFRADRAREILLALVDPEFTGFARPRTIRFAAALGMVSYSERLNRTLAVLFPPQDMADTLGEVVAKAGLKQLRIAETEKYAHVTFFFNGGEEREFPGETRILVPSPKIATYDLKPEMSALEVTDRLVEAIGSGAYDFIVVNYANTDMVGHTGDLGAAIKAVEAVDHCLGRLAEAVGRAGGVLLITADHGNAEMMRDHTTGQAHTAHTLNPVPVVLIHGPAAVTRLSDGRLADIAPTVLSLLGLPQPEAMTGRSLLVADAQGSASMQARRAQA
ncbi:MAG TPA: 2,3-bisphosphoglycerate-independent phosphoglycerate mutase [Alphaproteobacteria bacterium]|nr:2,3-bisphosphoglycerate-independent phosphoglycerate mutase [Alphaproteobacteria bacterium]